MKKSPVASQDEEAYTVGDVTRRVEVGVQGAVNHVSPVFPTTLTSVISIRSCAVPPNHFTFDGYWRCSCDHLLL